LPPRLASLGDDRRIQNEWKCLNSSAGRGNQSTLTSETE
jgi:hypothetical protein